MKIVKCLVGALALAHPSIAFAQDDWNGASIGVYVESSSQETEFEDTNCWASCSETSLQRVTPVIGATIGYDFQASDDLVFGVSAEVGTGSSKTDTAPSPDPGSTAVTNWLSKVDFQYSARARVGVSTGKSLVYVFGGASFAKADISVTARNFPVWWGLHSPNYEASWAGTLHGTTYGAGLEHRTGKISLRAELGITKYSPVRTCFANSDGPNVGVCWADPLAFPPRMQNSHSSTAARIGLNYRF